MKFSNKFSDTYVEQHKEPHILIGESICLKVKSFMIQPLLCQMPGEVTPAAGNNQWVPVFNPVVGNDPLPLPITDTWEFYYKKTIDLWVDQL